jgi:predicted GNAT family N-acyltransferase
MTVDDPAFGAVKQLRYECLYAEWGLPWDLVEDPADKTYLHLIAEEGDQIIGYARMHLEDGDSKILQVSVTPAQRGRGIAVALMDELMERAAVEGREDVYLDAREHVIGFYEKLGFEPEGEMFLSPRTNTPHIVMRRSLADIGGRDRG